MTCVVRTAGLEALAALITCAIPSLAGHVCISVAPSSEHEELPNMTLEPGRWAWEPAQRMEHAQLANNIVVWNVGRHSTPLMISIMASSPDLRAELEAQVLDVFLSSVHPLTGMPRAGVVVAPVTSCPSLSTWVAAFELESDEWINVDAFNRRYESRILVTALLPALYCQRPVYTLAELQLQLATPADIALPSPAGAIELVTINSDGTISPA